MSKEIAPAVSGEVVKVGASPRAISASVVEVFEQMLASVPDADSGTDARILEMIASADSLQDLDAPWNSMDLARLRDVELVFTGIRKAQSDFEGPLPWYLIVNCAEVETGEVFVVTTGAESVLAQLVRAWSLGEFPFKAILRVAAKPTAKGFYPQHLEIVK